MNMKRMRGRNHRPNGGGGGGGSTGGGFRNQQNGIPLNRNHVFDSSGPEMRVRGTAQQLYEKYQQLARDASSNGDRVTGESYYQHAEHYFRIISAINQAQGHPPAIPQNGQQNGQPVYQNGGQNGQDRNGAYNDAPNGQQNGHYNNQNNNHNRRPDSRPYDQNNDRQADHQQSDSAPQENRAAEPQRNEHRQAETRPQETRPQEPRLPEGRQFEPRRNDQPRRQDFQRNNRNNDRPERYQPETPVVDTRIDISSALEAELAAAVAEPRVVEQPVLEARAIPIIPDAPPPAEVPVAEAAAEPAPARAAPKPRGRPRVVKVAKE